MTFFFLQSIPSRGWISHLQHGIAVLALLYNAKEFPVIYNLKLLDYVSSEGRSLKWGMYMLEFALWTGRWFHTNTEILSNKVLKVYINQTPFTKFLVGFKGIGILGTKAGDENGAPSNVYSSPYLISTESKQCSVLEALTYRSVCSSLQWKGICTHSSLIDLFAVKCRRIVEPVAFRFIRGPLPEMRNVRAWICPVGRQLLSPRHWAMFHRTRCWTFKLIERLSQNYLQISTESRCKEQNRGIRTEHRPIYVPDLISNKPLANHVPSSRRLSSARYFLILKLAYSCPFQRINRAGGTHWCTV